MPGLTCACVCVCVSRYVRACQHHAYGLGAKWIRGAEASIPLQATLGLKAASAGIAPGRRRQRQLRQGAPTDVCSDRGRGCLSRRGPALAAGECRDRSLSQAMFH